MEERVASAVTALQQLSQSSELKVRDSGKRRLLVDSGDDKVQLLVCAVKVNNCQRLQTVKIQLPFSFNADASVCLLVKDLSRGIRTDHDKSQLHWQNVLRSAGVTRVTKVMPLRQLRAEFCMFEARRRLAENYDVFLADAAIMHMLPAYLGKHFYKTRKFPIQIDLTSKNLSQNIDAAIDSTYLRIFNSGVNSCVQIGKLSQTSDQLQQNVLAACMTLKHKFPGTMDNIRGIFLRMRRSSVSIPVFVSDVCDNQVPIPRAPFRPRDDLKPVVGELSTYDVRADVIVSPDGDVTVVPRAKKRRLADSNGDVRAKKLDVLKKRNLKKQKIKRTKN